MDNFLGEIRLFTYGFIPNGWLACEGQTLPINQYQALFALLANKFGGDARTNFKLPDLRYRAIIGQDYNIGLTLGTQVGSEKVTLTVNTLPQHRHLAMATSLPANVPQPRPNSMLGEVSGNAANIYGSATPDQMLTSNSLSTAGGSEAHNNMQPSIGSVSYTHLTLPTKRIV